MFSALVELMTRLSFAVSVEFSDIDTQIPHLPHVSTPHNQLSLNDFLSALETYGYEAPQVPYAKLTAVLQAYFP